MKKNKDYSTLLGYYKQNFFNPVPITVEDHEIWNTHFAKRRNLYERHLRIPLPLLRDRTVIEFGCGSGENALVLAMVGANLTLVEPNEQVLPRLNDLFEKFGLTDRVREIRNESIREFKPKSHYDLAIAEGFLYTLPDRDEMIQKMVNLLVPGGLAVISFNDRYGGLIEFTKRLVLWRSCHLSSEDIGGEGSLQLGKSLFGEDFESLKASRPFDAWWKDIMVNPFYTFKFLWSFPEILSIIEKIGCVFLSSSPKWNFIDYFNWYKNTSPSEELHSAILGDWKRVFSYILTGLRPRRLDVEPAGKEVIESVADLVSAISDYTSGTPSAHALEAIAYPSALAAYLEDAGDPRLNEFNDEMKGLYGRVRNTDVKKWMDSYLNAKTLRSFWGTPYHYLSFIKS